VLTSSRDSQAIDETIRDAIEALEAVPDVHGDTLEERDENEAEINEMIGKDGRNEGVNDDVVQVSFAVGIMACCIINHLHCSIEYSFVVADI
jgi:hypothetical protein